MTIGGDNMVDFLKRHDVLLGGLIIVLIILVVLALLSYKLFFSWVGSDLYGTRLAGIDKVPITDSMIGDIKGKISANEAINNITYDLKGKIANFVITVKDGTEVSSVKELAKTILTDFTLDQRNFYDIQVFIACENKENSAYPVIGYAHKKSQDFAWSNN